jgi:hypothetical protein
MDVQMTALLRWSLLIALAVSPVWTVAESSGCRVLDPELQGDYKGGCVNGLAEGIGEARGQARYVGGFVSGKKSGKGVKEWSNGDRYEGVFENDRKHGQGVYLWGKQSEWSGERFSGIYVDDKRHGYGTYSWPDGRKMSGRWIDDLPDLAQSPEWRHAARAYAERMVAVSRPGAQVCRKVAVGNAQTDVFAATVLGTTGSGELIRIRVTAIGRLTNEIDGREIKVGMELQQPMERWFPCRS